ncbi:MAG: 2-C-methyl-D-erythritol 4-phosphate cytidylyltransferase [Flavobacterium sp.]|nr:2-C-methyl-D-erythritol 4-phosphate cytidylyltransferase [Pedobacter sp.]
MKYFALIVAGGMGTRMKTDIPKQFLLLKKKPVLMHTIQAFFSSDLKPEIYLVLNIDFHQYWEKLCLEYEFNVPHRLIKAGKHRFDSVKNGLNKIAGSGIVAVHDAVRPVISNELITKSFCVAEEKGNAVCAVQPTDSVRKQNGEFTESMNRNQIFLIQTPQTFDVNVLKKAYKQPFKVNFTDDASVAENYGLKINLIPGDVKNIKITYPLDILIADLYLSSNK